VGRQIRWSNKLKDLDAGTRRVFGAAAAALHAANPNSDNELLAHEKNILELEHPPTTPTNALIVAWPQPRHVQQQQRQLLQLFKLAFRCIPTGSSGVPLIHQDMADFPLETLMNLPLKESSQPPLFIGLLTWTEKESGRCVNPDYSTYRST
jgi:hypothetical protein